MELKYEELTEEEFKSKLADATATMQIFSPEAFASRCIDEPTDGSAVDVIARALTVSACILRAEDCDLIFSAVKRIFAVAAASNKKVQ